MRPGFVLAAQRVAEKLDELALGAAAEALGDVGRRRVGGIVDLLDQPPVAVEPFPLGKLEYPLGPLPPRCQKRRSVKRRAAAMRGSFRESGWRSTEEQYGVRRSSTEYGVRSTDDPARATALKLPEHA